MLAKDIRKYIILPTLHMAGLNTESAEILVYGTGYVETGYDFVVQVGNPKNGGLGFFQDEPSDFLDLSTWLKVGINKSILDRVLSTCYFTCLPTDPTVLISNIKLAVLFCRLHYLRIKEALPPAGDARALARYHFKYFNSGGKANIDTNADIFQRIIDGEL